MGLINGTVKLENDYLNWNRMFISEQDILKKLFGNLALQIEHIGSTSVKGLYAKPIIDIAVGINDFDDVKEIIVKLESIYTVKFNKENDEILLIKEDSKKTYFLIHVMKINSVRYKNSIAFRDCLINNPKIKKSYEKLKISLSEKYSNDRKKYTKSKSEFIENVLNNNIKE